MDNGTVWLIGGGIVVGLLFGWVMQRSRFCMVAATSNMILVRDYRHAQAFLAAWAVAIAGTSLLESTELVLIADSQYRNASVDWLGATAGGLLFGFGAALAGGCATRTLVNSAEGHIGGLLALITMIMFSGITFYGALEPLRIELFRVTAVELAAADSGVATLLKIEPWVVGTMLAIICFILMRFLGSIAGNRVLILSGGAIGLLVVLGWFITGYLAQDVFIETAPKSAIITGPLARLHYSLATGAQFPFTFGTTFVIAMFSGAVISALAFGEFRWTRPDPARIPHYLIGGSLMGVGAITAGGCNIGQGVTGVSTLSITSLLAATAIFAGATAGIKWWERHA